MKSSAPLPPISAPILLKLPPIPVTVPWLAPVRFQVLAPLFPCSELPAAAPLPPLRLPDRLPPARTKALADRARRGSDEDNVKPRRSEPSEGLFTVRVSQEEAELLARIADC